MYAMLISLEVLFMLGRQAVKFKKQIWQTFPEPRLVDASVRFVPNKEHHKRVSHLTIHDWFGKQMELPHIHMYHKTRRSERLYHVFSCTDKNCELFFRMMLCPSTLRVYVLGVSGKYIDSYS